MNSIRLPEVLHTICEIAGLLAFTLASAFDALDSSSTQWRLYASGVYHRGCAEGMSIVTEKLMQQKRFTRAQSKR